NLLLFQYTGIHFNLRLDPFSIVIFIVKKFNKMAISLADFEKLFGGNFTNIVPGITKLPSFFISFVKVTHPSKCLSLFDEILIGVNSLLYNLILLSEMLSSSLEEVIQNRLKLLFNIVTVNLINRSGTNPFRFNFLKFFCGFLPVFDFGSLFSILNKGTFNFQIFNLVHFDKLGQIILQLIKPFQQNRKISNCVKPQQLFTKL